MPKGIYLDTNLLVLLVVGATKQDLILTHRRTQQFCVDDYHLLNETLDRFRHIHLTPNTLTEASNLIAQHAEPQRSKLLTNLAKLIRLGRETLIPSQEAVKHSLFTRLGLTDVALLEVISPEFPLLTADVKLYLAAQKAGENTAINFNHLRFP